MVVDFQKVLKENKKLKNKKSETTKKKYSKILTSKVISKDIIRPSNLQVTIQNKEVPSVLSDPNRFFNREMEDAKKSMFFG